MSPVKIPNDSTYALKLPFSGDDLSHTPYIAALATMATRTANLGEIYVPDPTKETLDLKPSACPPEKECIADSFSLYTYNSIDEAENVSASGSLGRLSFEGFPGRFVVVKDAPKNEGWHIYWKSDDGQGAQIEIDVVPVDAVRPYTNGDGERCMRVKGQEVCL